jgi:hypothetical protein
MGVGLYFKHDRDDDTLNEQNQFTNKVCLLVTSKLELFIPRRDTSVVLGQVE